MNYKLYPFVCCQLTVFCEHSEFSKSDGKAVHTLVLTVIEDKETTK